MAAKGEKDPFFKKVYESQKKFRTGYDEYQQLMQPSY